MGNFIFKNYYYILGIYVLFLLLNNFLTENIYINLTIDIFLRGISMGILFYLFSLTNKFNYFKHIVSYFYLFIIAMTYIF